MKQKQARRPREQEYGCQGGGEWNMEGLKVWDYQIKMIIYRLAKNNKVLLYSTGKWNYIQYPLINAIMEKKFKNNSYIHIYVHIYI